LTAACAQPKQHQSKYMTKTATMSTSTEKSTTAEPTELPQPATTENPSSPQQEQTQRGVSTSVYIISSILLFAYLYLAKALAPRYYPFFLAAANFPGVTVLQIPVEREEGRRSIARRAVDMWCVWPAFEAGNPWLMLAGTLAMNVWWQISFGPIIKSWAEYYLD
jgi:hypothetical protein